MDLGNSTVKTPEPESKTPTRIQPAKPPPLPPFTNGVLKRHAPLFHHHHHPVVVTYKECLKNHAAALGGHALDGCGEFMPSPASDPSDPTSLKCAACGCHRNFHRRDPEEPVPAPPAAVPALEYQPHHRHRPPPPNSGSSPNDSPSPPPISSAYYPSSAPHMLLALSHGLSPCPPPENNNNNNTPISAPVAAANGSRKRFRTKFTSYQKEKMLEISDRVGWKMQKRDEDVINEMCAQIGVDRSVFKVWMHNNKNTFGKKDGNNPSPPPPPPAAEDGNGPYLQLDGIPKQHENVQAHGGTTAHALGTNGSSSASIIP